MSLAVYLSIVTRALGPKGDPICIEFVPLTPPSPNPPPATCPPSPSPSSHGSLSLSLWFLFDNNVPVADPNKPSHMLHTRTYAHTSTLTLLDKGDGRNRESDWKEGDESFMWKMKEYLVKNLSTKCQHNLLYQTFSLWCVRQLHSLRS